MSVPHTDLNRARLPIPPRPHIHFMFSTEQKQVYYSHKQKASTFFIFFKLFCDSAIRKPGLCQRPGKPPTSGVFSLQVWFPYRGAEVRKARRTAE